MKIPQTPPDHIQLLLKMAAEGATDKLLGAPPPVGTPGEYLHWDKLRRLPMPEGWTPEELWTAIKFKRGSALKHIPLLDKKGMTFVYGVPDEVARQLHEIDMGGGGAIGVAEPITNAQTRDQYVVQSLMQEAITSSQLEGAVTTREVAKEMIRTGREPRDKSERMIRNNFATMRRIMEIREQPLTRDLVFEIHRIVTEKALDNASAAGRYRNAGETVAVEDAYGEVFHNPPPAPELPGRMDAMCDFANGRTPDFFVHPAIRAIILHFWLAYDHPFVDGNGRTARALFYWSMLHHGYWLFEFISISSILVQSPAKYAQSFLYTETDGNDLTYFIMHQADVIRRAIADLHAYINRRTRELRETESLLRSVTALNHRQEALIGHALRHPHARYTIEGHRLSHGVAYDTARNDLLGLQKQGFLEMKKSGKALVFFGVANLAEKVSSAAPSPRA
ncbi:MAG: Fic family protein [Chthoniobacteraceae bacterium]|nr:Fic family protein [Chthoniobacteraceae bacterium]